MDLTLIQDKDFEEKLNIQTKKISIIKEENSYQLRKKLKKESIVLAGNDKLNRFITENKKVSMILSPEIKRKKDFMHSRDSGLNQVLCKLLAKNNISVGFSFSLILNSNNKASLLGKMQQNVKLCRKYKVKMRIASFAQNKWEFRSEDSLISFGKIIGMKPNEVEKALN